MVIVGRAASGETVVVSRLPGNFIIDCAAVILASIAVFLGAVTIPQGNVLLSLAAAILMVAALALYFRSMLLGKGAGFGGRRQ
jgi:hypothetical protein